VTEKTLFTRRIVGGYCYVESMHRGQLHVLSKCATGWAVAVMASHYGPTVTYRTYSTLVEVCRDARAFAQLSPALILDCL